MRIALGAALLFVVLFFRLGAPTFWIPTRRTTPRRRAK